MRKRKSKNTKKGLVFNVQRFSIHDGPGIRTTVFMKGCPMKCLWCSNPESQDFFQNLIVRNLNCKGCGACVSVCPQGAIKMSDRKGRQIDWGKCNQCLICADVCIYNSLNVCGMYVDIKDVLDEVMRDMDFYKNSGGGVTISGGEALLQAEFVAAVIAACKKMEIHTVLDTTGYAPWAKMKAVLKFVDLVLFDLKHLDCVQHRKATSVGNELILENMNRTAKERRIWLRMPVISGFNDSEQDIQKIAILGKSLNVIKISLLPYHEGGKTKCEQMGKVYPLRRVKVPTDEHMQRLKELIEGEGVICTIGS
ncbi:MAG: glycyl-radical enzyme activating protein [Deltaproteobacteria bacterium]|nr:glycyl-radical enzyme activating protein [Deltaproteobacteria bacterium]